jgi:hypothetical protein
MDGLTCERTFDYDAGSHFPLVRPFFSTREVMAVSDEPITGPSAEPIGVLEAAIDAVCGADPAHLADGETIAALHRQLERLEAATTRATASFEAGRAWEGDGARSAAAWLAACCRLPAAAARKRVHLGRALRHMAATEAAWLAGDIGQAHVVALDGARTPATAECFERDEAMLVGYAATLRYSHFVRALAYWSQMADPDGTEEDAEAQHQARRLHLSRTFDGKWFLEGVFDPVGGRYWPGPFEPSRTSCSPATGPRPGPAWAMACAPPTWLAPRPSAGPTP